MTTEESSNNHTQKGEKNRKYSRNLPENVWPGGGGEASKNPEESQKILMEVEYFHRFIGDDLNKFPMKLN